MTSSHRLARIDEATAVVRRHHPDPPRLGIVAGSGLGTLGTLVQDATRLPYTAIPGMPQTSVIGHAGELVLGHLEGLPVAVLSGRVHLYEGHPPDEVVLGVRMLARLGVQSVLLTNAAGAIAPGVQPGDLLRITDHINMTGSNPLEGPNIEALGPRFPDMSHAYCPTLGARLDRVAEVEGINLHHGTYACMRGPSYETPAEIQMLRVVGASVVGMSTVLETIALRHMGVNVCGISVASNLAAGVSKTPLDHGEVKEMAQVAGPRLVRLVRALARDLAETA
jgi:purine-nucleoside phosphorylase